MKIELSLLKQFKLFFIEWNGCLTFYREFTSLVFDGVKIERKTFITTEKQIANAFQCSTVSAYNCWYSVSLFSHLNFSSICKWTFRNVVTCCYRCFWPFSLIGNGNVLLLIKSCYYISFKSDNCFQTKLPYMCWTWRACVSSKTPPWRHLEESLLLIHHGRVNSKMNKEKSKDREQCACLTFSYFYLIFFSESKCDSHEDLDDVMICACYITLSNWMNQLFS